MQTAEQRNAPYSLPGRNGFFSLLHRHGADLGISDMKSVREYMALEIWEVHKTLPDDISLADRIKAISHLYPGKYASRHAQQSWQKARFDYLRRFGYVKRGGGRKPKNDLFN